MSRLGMTWRNWWYRAWAFGALPVLFGWGVLINRSWDIQVVEILVNSALVATGLVASVHLLRQPEEIRYVAVSACLAYVAVAIFLLAEPLSDPIWIRIGWEHFWATGSFAYQGR